MHFSPECQWYRAILILQPLKRTLRFKGTKPTADQDVMRTLHLGMILERSDMVNTGKDLMRKCARS